VDGSSGERGGGNLCLYTRLCCIFPCLHKEEIIERKEEKRNIRASNTTSTLDGRLDRKEE
jgi:hypothetical protein